MNEVPPVPTLASGQTTVTLLGNFLSVFETFSGLTTPATSGTLHCCTTPGTNTGVAILFPGFPAASSGTYSMAFDLTDSATYLSTFLFTNGGTAASAGAALIAGLNGGLVYLNVHDAIFPGGEIRGQLTAVPEPATWTLGAAGLCILAWRCRRRPATRSE